MRFNSTQSPNAVQKTIGLLLIANKYAAILGEDLCRQDKLEDLIAIMQEGQANTVSEAIAVYKGQKASR